MLVSSPHRLGRLGKRGICEAPECDTDEIRHSARLPIYIRPKSDECLAANYDGECFLARRCGVKRIMSHAQEAFLIALNEHTLAEVSGIRRTP